jgi:hypothetical protein
MLIEAKQDKETFMDSVPEATSQAIALSEVTGCVFDIFALTSLITVYLAIRPFGIVCPMETGGCSWCTLAMTKEIASGTKAQYS